MVPRAAMVIRFDNSVSTYGTLKTTTALYHVMPQIDVSEPLQEKLEDAAGGEDLEPALWEMVYRFERGNGSFE